MIKLLNRLQKPTSLLRTPEEEVLLLCMRRQFTPTQVEQIRSLLGKGQNWDYLITLAEHHGITGILYENLKHHFSEFVPEAAGSALQRQFETVKMTHLILVTELRRTLHLFADAGITVVPMKGPLLAFMVYQNPLWRECSDLDLLVRKEDLTAVQQLLEQDGFQIIDLGKRKLRGLKAAVEEEYHVSLKHSRSGIVIELHWSVVTTPSLFTLDTQAFWANLTPFTTQGISFLTPPPDDLLLILAVHGVKHRWYQLKWLYDIAEFINHYEGFDWHNLLCKAQQTGVKRILLMNFWMAHSLLQVALPDEIMEAIKDDEEAIYAGTAYISTWIFNGAKSWLDRARTELFCVDAWETIEKQVVYICSYALASASSKESGPVRVSLAYATANMIWLVTTVYRRVVRKQSYSA